MLKPSLGCFTRPGQVFVANSTRYSVKSSVGLLSTCRVTQAGRFKISIMIQSRCFSWKEFFKPGDLKTRQENVPVGVSESTASANPSQVIDNTVNAASAGAETSTGDTIASTVGDAACQVSNTVADASNHIGYLQSVGLAESWIWPTGFIQHILEMVHVYGGLPWWATILAVTWGLRLVMSPLFVKASDAQGKMSAIKGDMDDLTRRAHEAAGDTRKTQLIAIERTKLMRLHGISPIKTMLPVIAMPFALFGFFAVQGLGHVPVSGYDDQGTLWFQSLVDPDPFLGLQIITASMFSAFVYAGGETGANASILSPTIRKALLFLPFISIPFTMSLPAGTIVFFFANGTYSLAQSLFLRSKKCRNFLNLHEILPPPPPDPNNPVPGPMDMIRKSLERSKEQAAKQAKEKAEYISAVRKAKDQPNSAKFDIPIIQQKGNNAGKKVRRTKGL